MMSRSKNSILRIAGLLWIFAVAGGTWAMWSHQSTPGPSANPITASWPNESIIRLTPNQPNLIMFAHPHCPCTRASIGELALLMAQAQGKVSAHVLFFKPADAPVDWEKSDTWISAESIPGVEVQVDEDGREAARFGSHTSGQSMLYDQQGILLFSGGITDSRGHAGDNAGRSAIVAIVTQGASEQSSTPVFGCALQSPDSDCRRPSNANVRR
jgi:hypothetical protein